MMYLSGTIYMIMEGDDFHVFNMNYHFKEDATSVCFFPSLTFSLTGIQRLAFTDNISNISVTSSLSRGRPRELMWESIKTQCCISFHCFGKGLKKVSL